MNTTTILRLIALHERECVQKVESAAAYRFAPWSHEQGRSRSFIGAGGSRCTYRAGKHVVKFEHYRGDFKNMGGIRRANVTEFRNWLDAKVKGFPFIPKNVRVMALRAPTWDGRVIRHIVVVMPYYPLNFEQHCDLHRRDAWHLWDSLLDAIGAGYNNRTRHAEFRKFLWDIGGDNLRATPGGKPVITDIQSS